MLVFKTITPDFLLPILKSVFPKTVDWERCLIFYNKIYWFSTYKKNQKLAGAEVPLNYLRSILGGKEKTKLIIEKMIELGVITVSSSYVAKLNAKRYTITKQFRMDGFNKAVRKVTEYKNIKALTNAVIKTNLNKKLKLPDYEHIWFNLQNVGIDEYVAEKYIRNVLKPDNQWQLEVLLNSIYRISNQAIYASRGKNGRLNTPFTNLKKELRKFLFDRIDGQKDFIEVDIRNAQPLLISIFLKNKYPKLKTKPDFVKWNELCEVGKIYDFIANELELDRDTIKDRFMDTLLFTARNKIFLLEGSQLNEKNKAIQTFSKKFIQLFPTVWQMLLDIKSEIGNREFALKIQRMESELMIDQVLPQLKNIGTHFTIHDSIVCKQEDVKLVKNTIKKAFVDMYKSEVNIKEKDIYSDNENPRKP